MRIIINKRILLFELLYDYSILNYTLKLSFVYLTKLLI